MYEAAKQMRPLNHQLGSVAESSCSEELCLRVEAERNRGKTAKSKFIGSGEKTPSKRENAAVVMAWKTAKRPGGGSRHVENRASPSRPRNQAGISGSSGASSAAKRIETRR